MTSQGEETRNSVQNASSGAKAPEKVHQSEDSGEELGSLLDDALNDFDFPTSRSVSEQEELKASSSSASQTAQKFDPLGKKPKSRSRQAPRFDPLATSLRGSPGSSKPGQAQESRFGAIPPDVSDMDKELAKGLEQLMKELAQVDQEAQHAGGSIPAASSQFAETMRALSESQDALRDLRKASDPAQPEAAADSFNDPILAGLQEQLSRSGDGQEALGSFADGIMRQLLSKDVLYQPMKDIAERYPDWLEAHGDSLPEEEMARFKEQYEHIQAILRIYELEPDDYSKLFSTLQKMQACGQPPQDIVNDLAPGMSFDEDGLPKLPQAGGGAPPGCSLQ